ncbi:MAG TPA: hypothetical protein VHA13_05120 [Gammaproteobacteria bacterium]|nr:hypothetical protein [Gammaproteobacteria bacterium]
MTKNHNEIDKRIAALKCEAIKNDLAVLAQLLQACQRLNNVHAPVIESFLWSAVEFYEEELDTARLNVLASLQQAVHSARNYLEIKVAQVKSAKDLLSALTKLQNEIKGPYFYRPENAGLRKLVAALTIIAALALFTISLFLSPIITLAGAITVCAMSGALLGAAVYCVLNVEKKTISSREQKSLDAFSSSAKALVKTSPLAFFAKDRNEITKQDLSQNKLRLAKTS